MHNIIIGHGVHGSSGGASGLGILLIIALIVWACSSSGSDKSDINK